jgi:hypothetical protein
MVVSVPLGFMKKPLQSGHFCNNVVGFENSMLTKIFIVVEGDGLE